MSRHLLATFFVFLTWFLVGASESVAELQVVAHKDNPVSSITKQDLSKLFLKKRTRWPNGSKVKPINLSEGNSARQAFLSEIHGMDEAGHKKYWIKLVFAGRAHPPDEVDSPEEMLSTLAHLPQAVGYVPDDVALPDGVKILEITK